MSGFHRRGHCGRGFTVERRLAVFAVTAQRAVQPLVTYPKDR
jgi:hypothetical protein